jgi:hypothetical protein
MESGRRETPDDECDEKDGDVFVPANAAVAANVLSGASSAEEDVEEDAETDQGN